MQIYLIKLSVCRMLNEFFVIVHWMSSIVHVFSIQCEWLKYEENYVKMMLKSEIWPFSWCFYIASHCRWLPLCVCVCVFASQVQTTLVQQTFYLVLSLESKIRGETSYLVRDFAFHIYKLLEYISCKFISMLFFYNKVHWNRRIHANCWSTDR